MESIEHYLRRKRHYQDETVAKIYEMKRFGGLFGWMRHMRDITAIRRAIRFANSLGTQISFVLDVPCGTGRIFQLLSQKGIKFIGADISHAMLLEAMGKPKSHLEGLVGLVVSDAEWLPFKDGTFDAVMCIRFMFHVPREIQLRILKEMRRVTNRWGIVEFRHRYTLRYLSNWIRYKLGLLGELKYRFSKHDLEELVSEAGFKVRAIFPTRPYAPFLSDKWIVLLEKV
ncbi:MAG: methyltransferase domain-containing protein [Armatimonadota bacterium]|nr:methyltransferase domain-containing protein [Armatimonadota bacterium]MDW8026426.1 methyltransferase domain-containing protein [Armatimonadota bacterium]